MIANPPDSPQGIDERLTEEMVIAFIDGKHDFTVRDFAVHPADIKGMKNVLALLVQKGVISSSPPDAAVVEAVRWAESLKKDFKYMSDVYKMKTLITAALRSGRVDGKK